MMGKPGTYNVVVISRGKFVPQEIRAEKIEIDEHPFLLHHGLRQFGGTKGWVVSEYYTGRWVAAGETRREAIHIAELRVQLGVASGQAVNLIAGMDWVNQ